MANTPPKKLYLFLLGAVAPLTVYVIFYATHARELIAEIKQFNQDSGPIGFVVVAVLFTLVAAMCGGWALLCESKTYKAAFSSGLGLPALILSGSGAFGPAAEKSKAESFLSPRHSVYVASLLPYAPMFATAEPSVLSRAFSIVFNPVGTVVKTETAAVKQTNVQLQQQTATLQQTNSILIATQQAVQTKVVSLEGKLADAQQSEEQAVKLVKAANEKSTALAVRLVEQQSQINSLDASTSELSKTVEGLTQQVAESNRKLAASGDDHEVLIRKIQRLQNEQKSIKEEYDRVIATLARSVNPKAINILRDELQSVKSDEVKTSINKAIEAIPGVKVPIGVRIIP